MRFLPLVLLMVSANARGQIILSEVMYNPAGSEQTNEFIELYNAGDSLAISLAGWRIGDDTAQDEIIPARSEALVSSKGFAVILDEGYFQSSTQYDSIIPPDAIILTINDNTLGSGGLSNSTAETIVLIDASGDTVARYTYSLGNPDGVSDEKIILNDDDSESNWGNSLQANGTPGKSNSVSPSRIDAELVAGSLQITPKNPRAGTPVQVSVLIRNLGMQPVAQLTVAFELYSHGREFGLPVLLGEVTTSSPLSSEDTICVNLDIPELKAGRHLMLASLSLTDDANARNDTSSMPIAVAWAAETLVLNEIMYAPAGGQAEWVELYNPQIFSVPLSEWKVEDEAGGRGFVQSTISIPARSFRVLSASYEVAVSFNLPDSTVILLNRLPSLNNSGDAIAFCDFTGALIDSVAFEGDWGIAGRSIEKIWYERNNTRLNWLPCRAAVGATPGAFNSVSPRDYDLELGALQSIPANPHFGDQVRIGARVRNLGRKTLSDFSVAFYHDPTGLNAWSNAILLDEIGISDEVASEESVAVSMEWFDPPSGKNLVLAELKDDRDLVFDNNRAAAEIAVGYASRSVVINEVMYDARSGEPEWFELYNRSSASADLSQWLWVDGDAATRSALPDERIYQLAPGGFAVVSSDSAISGLDAGSLCIVSSKWNTLNNDRERIILWDFNAGFQDSLAFSNKWGGASGFSLERINPNVASQDSSNWSTCVEMNGGTPGRRNSIFTASLPSSASISINPSPFSPDDDGIEDYAIINMNFPVTTALANVKIFDLRGRLVRHLLNNKNVGSSYQAVWNGSDDDGRPVRTGLYIVLMQAIRADEGKLFSAKTTVVVAR